MIPLYTQTKALEGRKTLVIADTDNLDCSFKRLHGLELDAAALRNRLWAPTQKLKAAAVLTSHPGMNFMETTWGIAGWDVTTVIREKVKTCRGNELLANADFEIVFTAATLVATNPHFDSILLCTGDGTLATSIAREVRRRRPNLSVVSCAVPGAASSRLRDTSLFDAYIELGADVTTCAALCA